jgi:hypothetical protein
LHVEVIRRAAFYLGSLLPIDGYVRTVLVLHVEVVWRVIQLTHSLRGAQLLPDKYLPEALVVICGNKNLHSPKYFALAQ